MNEQEKKAYAEERAHNFWVEYWKSLWDRGIIHNVDAEKHKGLVSFNFKSFEDFILSVIKDCQPKVSREFVEKWETKMNEFYYHRKEGIKLMLKEARVEVEG